MSVEYTRDVMSAALTAAIAELPEDFWLSCKRG